MDTPLTLDDMLANARAFEAEARYWDLLGEEWLSYSNLEQAAKWQRQAAAYAARKA